ncbi:MAG: hypothetical protein KJO69_03850 [Gammaproteobacteria bacterium]|nr:hypothetical protein [Gammaproteobacteria bacterium]
MSHLSILSLKEYVLNEELSIENKDLCAYIEHWYRHCSSDYDMWVGMRFLLMKIIRNYLKTGDLRLAEFVMPMIHEEGLYTLDKNNGNYNLDSDGEIGGMAHWFVEGKGYKGYTLKDSVVTEFMLRLVMNGVYIPPQSVTHLDESVGAYLEL